MRPPWVAVLLAVAFLYASPVSAGADVVHLKAGGRIVGRTSREGDKVRVVMHGGTLEIPSADVESIEEGDTPAEAFVRRRAGLVPGDTRAALELAAIADDAGLTAERGEVLGLAAAWAPHDAAIRALLERWRLFERELPENPRAEAALAAALSPHARIYRTAHWRIAYDCDLAIVRRRAEMLEAAWRKFHGLVARAGLAANPVEDRLECMVFREHADWLAAVGMPEEQVGAMVGVYMSRTRRVLLYDTRTSPAARAAEKAVKDEIAALGEARAALERQEREIERIETAIEDGTAARRKDPARLAALVEWLARARAAVAEDGAAVRARERQLERYRDELLRHHEDENVASTTHEACHQLAFALGVSRAGQPLWLVEGLATLFEAQSRTSFVLEAPNEPRLADLRKVWSKGNGAKDEGRLVDVVTDAVFAVRGAEGAAYAQCWALCYFLAVKRAPSFARFLKEGALLPAGPDAAAERLADFKRFFGEDLDALDREWRAYVERL